MKAESAVLHNSEQTTLEEIVITNGLEIVSAGEVLQDDEGILSIGGLLKITSDEDVLLTGGVDTQIESVDLSGAGIVLVQEGDVSIAGLVATSNVLISSSSGNVQSETNSMISLGENGLDIFVNNSTGVIDLSGSENDFGELTLIADSAVIAEGGTILINNITANTLTLESIGAIESISTTNLSVADEVNLTAGSTITIGLGIQESVTLGVINLSSENGLAHLVIDGVASLGAVSAESLNLSAIDSITDVPSSNINVTGLAVLNSIGADSQILIDGGSNSFSRLDVTANTVSLDLVSDTTIEGVMTTGDFTLDLASGNSLMFGADAMIVVDQQALVRADRVIFEAGSSNEFGGINIRTASTEGSIVEIRSDISQRLNGVIPTNSDGTFVILSPTVVLGQSGETTMLSTSDSSILISGIDADGNADAAAGALQIAGDAIIDSTNAGSASGADINLVADGVALGRVLSEVPTESASLTLSAGTSDISIGHFIEGAEINSFTVASAGNLFLADVFVSGNTVNVTTSGDVFGTGVIEDSIGDIEISSEGRITLQDRVSAAGDVRLTSGETLESRTINAGNSIAVSTNSDLAIEGDVAASRGGVTLESSIGSVTGNSITGADVEVRAGSAVLLGSNVTATAGSVTIISSEESVTAVGDIAAATDLDIAAGSDVTLEMLSANSGAITVFSVDGQLLFNQNVSASTDFTALAATGGLSQAKDTLIETGGNLTLSTDTSMNISSLSAGENVTLVIRNENPDVMANFVRVNDAITFGDAAATPDISSEGSISFLAPTASVGDATAGQNFVQRSGAGIFYGLDSGSFFSDDIGTSAILTTIPSGVANNLVGPVDCRH